jgi:hypothetical protein
MHKQRAKSPLLEQAEAQSKPCSRIREAAAALVQLIQSFTIDVTPETVSHCYLTCQL